MQINRYVAYTVSFCVKQLTNHSLSVISALWQFTHIAHRFFFGDPKHYNPTTSFKHTQIVFGFSTLYFF